MRQRLGPAIEVEYVDLADQANQTRFSDLVALVEDQKLPYPLVAVNGQLRLAGSAHYYRVLPLVEEALAAPSTS